MGECDKSCRVSALYETQAFTKSETSWWFLACMQLTYLPPNDFSCNLYKRFQERLLSN